MKCIKLKIGKSLEGLQGKACTCVCAVGSIHFLGIYVDMALITEYSIVFHQTKKLPAAVGHLMVTLGIAI